MSTSPNSSAVAYGAAFLFLCWLVWAVTGFVGGHVTGLFGAFNVTLSGAALAAVGWLAYQFKGKPPEPEDQDDGAGSVGLVGLALLFVWLAMAGVIAIVWAEGGSEKMGQFGDAFGALNALFSGAALGGAVYAVILQRMDFKLTLKEYSQTREASQKSAEAQERAAKAQQVVATQQERTAMIHVLTTMIEVKQVDLLRVEEKIRTLEELVYLFDEDMLETWKNLDQRTEGLTLGDFICEHPRHSELMVAAYGWPIMRSSLGGAFRKIALNGLAIKGLHERVETLRFDIYRCHSKLQEISGLDLGESSGGDSSEDSSDLEIYESIFDREEDDSESCDEWDEDSEESKDQTDGP